MPLSHIRKYFLLLCFILNIALNSFAQGLNSWVQKSDLPGISRTAAVSFTILEKAYIGTGLDSNGILLNDFWQYDPATDSWMQLADFAGTARTGAIGFGIDSAGYVGLGYDGLLKKDLWKYDPITNAWSAEQDLGQYRTASGNARRDASVAVSEGKAYIICGYDGSTSAVKQCWQFNPKADTSWTIRKNFMNTTDFAAVGRSHLV